MIFRNLKGLTDHLSVSTVHPDMFDDGLSFQTDENGANGNTLFGYDFLFEVYQKSEPKASTRVTVPILWDTKTDKIVSNESSEIIRMFNSAFKTLTGKDIDLWPVDLRSEIEKINTLIYSAVNNGVNKSGFATTQGAYDVAVQALFEQLEMSETRLAHNRYLLGDRITEADWRLFTTLVRFDLVYHQHFKCNRKRLIDYPNLWGFTHELFQWPGVREIVSISHIVGHYHCRHESIIDWEQPHGRGQSQNPSGCRNAQPRHPNLPG